MRFLCKAALVFSLCFFPLTGIAWNALGHMVVANIAYQNLQPRVREKVDALVSFFHEEYPEIESFLQMAYWPDTLHSQKVETFNHWHYIDVAFSLDNTPLKNVMDTDNVLWAINKIDPIVQNAHGNSYERARFLAFLTHIVGDIHQPLHTVSLISAAHPDGDAGGNLYLVRYDNVRINLHKIWDCGVGYFSNDLSLDHVNEVTHLITTLYPEEYFGKQSTDLNPTDWVSEGMQHATQYVYVAPEFQELSPEYIQTGKTIAQQEVALAGYRLAHLLNQLLA